ncbi:MAG: hypothetical protein ACRC62_11355 [Microcoleus sp.]
MNQSQPPLPQPQLEPSGITFDQYVEFTPAKLELSDGYLGYGGQNPTGFHLAVLTNMGLNAAVRRVGASLWIAALENYLRSNLSAANTEPEVAAAMLDRLNQGIAHLESVADFIQE